MKSLKQYYEEISEDPLNYKGSGLPKFQKFKPRIFPGIPHNSSPLIIETVEEINQLINAKYRNNINLVDIIRLYGEHNIKLSEHNIVHLDVKDVDMVKEYNRSKTIYSSKRTPDQYEDLMEDIKTNGINECGRIRLNRNSDNTIGAILGEGNHRLSVAKLLKLSTMPIRIVYTT